MREYAPLYSRKERVRIALLLLAIMAPLLLIAHFWLIPAISAYTELTNCDSFGDVDGVHLLLYGVFVYLPLSFAIILLLLLGRRCMRVIRAGQDPLPGEKVLRPTKYRYGKAAMIVPALVPFLVVVTVGFSIWGSFQAEKLTRIVAPCSEPQLIKLKPSS